MPLFNMTELRDHVAPGHRLLGIDPGSKTIGLALSDVRLRLATPYGSLRRGRLSTNATEIMRVARREDVAGFVVGLPLSMEGEYGPAAQAARDWTHALMGATGLPAAMWDERMTTSDALEWMVEADFSRARRASVVDRVAAAAILQAALDAVAEGAIKPPPLVEPDAPNE